MTTAIRRALIATLLVAPGLAPAQNTNRVDASVGNSAGVLCTNVASNTNGAPLTTNANCGVHNPQPPNQPPVTNYNGFANANGTPYDQHANMSIGGVITPGTDLYIQANTIFYMYLTLPSSGGTLRVNQFGNIHTGTGGAAPPSAAFAFTSIAIGAINSAGMATNYFADMTRQVNGPFNLFLDAILAGAPPTFSNTYLVAMTSGVKGSFNNFLVAQPGGPPPQPINFIIDGSVDARITSLQYIDPSGNVTQLSGAPTFTPPVTVTPEPATMTLLATGLAGIAAARRRRRKSD